MALVYGDLFYTIITDIQSICTSKYGESASIIAMVNRGVQGIVCGVATALLGTMCTSRPTQADIELPSSSRISRSRSGAGQRRIGVKCMLWRCGAQSRGGVWYSPSPALLGPIACFRNICYDLILETIVPSYALSYRMSRCRKSLE